MGTIDKIQVVGEWKEDLSWCPSQLYLKLKHGENHFVIYLRWRHQDPWTATLIQTEADYNPIGGDWHPLDIYFYGDKDYKKLQEDIVDVAKKYIYSGQLTIKN